jgi:hypothetical protein
MEQLQREIHDLKLLVADLALQVERFKKTTIPQLDGNSGV